MPHKRTDEGHIKQKVRCKKYKTFEQHKKEADTIRGIVKDLNPRDLLTGEIMYSLKNEAIVKAALATGFYEVTDWRGDKSLEPFDPETLKQIACFEYGQVLNRGFEPCWWLSHVNL